MEELVQALIKRTDDLQKTMGMLIDATQKLAELLSLHDAELERLDEARPLPREQRPRAG